MLLTTDWTIQRRRQGQMNPVYTYTQVSQFSFNYTRDTDEDGQIRPDKKKQDQGNECARGFGIVGQGKHQDREWWGEEGSV